MKLQQTLYFKRQTKLGDNKKVRIESYVEAQEHEKCVVYEGKRIKITDKNEKETAIAGLISVSEKKNSVENQSIDNLDSIIDEKIAIHKNKRVNERIVGYVELNEKTYAVVNRRLVGINYILILLVAIITGLVMVKPMKISVDTGQVVIEQINTEDSTINIER